LTEEQIIQWLQARDKRAVSAVYDQYSSALYGLVLRIVRTEDVAKDVMQETFIKVWKYSDRYDPQKGTLFTWLINIARNTALNTLQSKGFRNQQKNQPLENLVHHNEGSRLSHQFNINEIGLKGIVTQLEEKYREVIDLIYFQGYTHQEAQEHLNIPLGTVKSRIRIALRELRRIFEHQKVTIISLIIWLGLQIL